jgi:hypothetical protein
MRKDNEASHAGEKAVKVLGGGFSTAFSFCHTHDVYNKTVFGTRVKEASFMEHLQM